VNVILQLKCSIREIDDYIQKSNWKYQNLTYNPSIPTDIQAYEDNTLQKNFGDYSSTQENAPGFAGETELNSNTNNNNSASSNVTINSIAVESDKKGMICSCCQSKSSETAGNSSLKESEIQKIKQLKIAFYKNEMQEKKSDCFWCTYPYDNDPCYILQYGYNNEIYGHGSFCSPECGVAFLFGKQSTWDDSAKTESYQLMNYYYGKPNGFQQSIKPALSPYYFLEKFYGNLNIQEYRKLLKHERLLLVVDKPLSKLTPELYDENEDYILNNKSINNKQNSTKNYKINVK
jgi:hypothetical protein